MDDSRFESCISRFERDWTLRGPREIADYLGDLNGATDHERTRLLVELICIDLEFRWKRCVGLDQRRLEDYLERLPELTSLDRLPVELVGEEYRVRTMWGDAPSHSLFLRRFPQIHDELHALMIEIDNELEKERLGSEFLTGLEACSENTQCDAELIAENSLLSHRDFLLQRLIGAGRMGKVCAARRRCEVHAVAVKFLRKSLLDDPRVVRRFIREARTVARLHHPHIVGAQGLGRTPGGSYFIVMDLVAGPSLATLSSRRPITVAEAIGWGIELCAAIEHAHERGIIHCDLKPANILLCESGKIRIADFGLARSIVGETPDTVDIEGTAPFMAPEQVSRLWGNIDRRTDIYGFGAVLFTLLTGRPPFVRDRLADILLDVVGPVTAASPATLRPDLTQSLCELCRKCLSKAPEGRYQTMREVRSALDKLAGVSIGGGSK